MDIGAGNDGLVVCQCQWFLWAGSLWLGSVLFGFVCINKTERVFKAGNGSRNIWAAMFCGALLLGAFFFFEDIFQPGIS